MGYFLRHNFLFCASKFLRDSPKSGCSRDFKSLSRLFASDGSSKDKDSHSSMAQPLVPGDDSFSEKFMKFQNQEKIRLPLSDVKEEDYTLGPVNDGDVFGTLDKTNPYLVKVEQSHKEDKKEMQYSSELPNYLPHGEYWSKIRKYLSQRRFADALAVLQVTMLKEHRVKPEYYIYGTLISYCGETGYTKMAFKLYNDMKRRDLPVKSSVYTSLFNACANSPYPSDGLQRARNLLLSMNEKNIIPNQITCHAILKALGRCGSVEEAFKFVDFMMAKKMTIEADTMSFLFQACISDRQAGFRHVLLVYRKMMEYHIKPDVIHYNLLLRCVQDCGLGDIESIKDVLLKLDVKNVDKFLSHESVNSATQPLEGNENLNHQLDSTFKNDEGYPWEESEDFNRKMVSGPANKNVQRHSGDLELYQPKTLLPNLLSRYPTLECVVTLGDITTPQDRLFLLGGLEGFMEEMAKHGVQANIKTLTLLLNCIPKTCVAENSLLNLMKKFKLKSDMIFYNSIIKRRAHRKQYPEAKELLSLMSADGLHPDLMTFTNLAMTCLSKLEACELLKALDQSGLRPNIELATTLLGNAAKNFQMSYIDLVLRVVEYEEMKVDQLFLKKLIGFRNDCAKVMKIRPDSFTPSHRDAIQNFCKKYPEWVKRVEKEDEVHPWQHLRTRHPDSQNEFFSEHVEQHAPKAQFSRFGPNSNPRVRREKAKTFKKENPDLFQRKTVLKQLEGISSIQYQELLAKPSEK